MTENGAAVPPKVGRSVFVSTVLPGSPTPGLVTSAPVNERLGATLVTTAVLVIIVESPDASWTAIVGLYLPMMAYVFEPVTSYQVAVAVDLARIFHPPFGLHHIGIRFCIRDALWDLPPTPRAPSP
jgi:hypothetical protein